MKSILLKLCTAALLGSAAAAANVQSADLHVMSSGGFTAAYKLLGPKFAASTGNTLDTALGPSMGKSPEAIPNRLQRGELADVVIMVGYALDGLIKQGKVIPDSGVELADSRIGMVVRDGAPKPDIGSEAALKETLLHARSIAYSDSASGVYIERELFKRLLELEEPLALCLQKSERLGRNRRPNGPQGQRRWEIHAADFCTDDQS